MNRLVIGFSMMLLSASCFGQTQSRSPSDQGTAENSQQMPEGPRKQITRTDIPDLLSLNVSESKVLQHEGATVLRDLACDSEGNPYFATTVRVNGELTDMVARWDLKENTLVRFTLANSPELRGFSALRGYGIGPNGDLYLPVWTLPNKKAIPDVYIAKFQKDGTFERNIRIEQDIGILQIGVFPSGNFLLVAIKSDRKRSDSPPPRQYLTGVFRSDGQLLREISGRADSVVQAGVKSGDPLYTNPTMTIANDRTVEMGSSHVGADGLVYAMRRMTPVLVNVYSESGELVRTLRIEPPAKDLLPAWFQVADGMIAIYFRPQGNGLGVFLVADSQTGERRAVFDGTGHSQAFACFSNPYRFTVISSTPEGQLAARILEPAH